MISSAERTRRRIVASIRRIFFGCNYNDKRIKSQFDALKDRLEKRFPIQCVVIDKRKNKPAQDIWKDIKDEIDQCGLVFFDVTAFRPNVVLELGYALALKAESQVYITFRKRKSKGKQPSWLLSDISHLNRFEYTTVAKLDEFVEEQLRGSEWMQRVSDYERRCESQTNAPEKYKAEGLKVLHLLRDEGPKTAEQIREITRGSAIRQERLRHLLTTTRVARRTRGQPGRFYLPED